MDDTESVARRSWWSRAGELLAPVLLVGWIVLSVALPLVGERSADAEDLRDRIAAGEVDEVTARGEIGPDETGSSVVELRWSDGWTNSVTSVVQVRGNAGRDSLGGAEVTGRFRGDLTDYLTASGGTVTVRAEPYRSGAQSETPLGWQLHGAWAAGFWLLFLATLAHLVSGPRPYLATRWAWFWLLGIPPLGQVAYLVVGRGVAPTRVRRDGVRLRGGWAFLLSVVLGTVLTAAL